MAIVNAIHRPTNNLVTLIESCDYKGQKGHTFKRAWEVVWRPISEFRITSIRENPDVKEKK